MAFQEARLGCTLVDKLGLSALKGLTVLMLVNRTGFLLVHEKAWRLKFFCFCRLARSNVGLPFGAQSPGIFFPA